MTSPDAHLPQAADVPVIARRAARRALAERALEGERARGPAPEAPAVFASVAPAASPDAPMRHPAERQDRAVVTAAALSAVPDGGRFVVEPGARITPLAEDEAARRGIRFVAGGAAQLRPAGALRVALASDHGGFALKGALVPLLRELGHNPRDLGPATDAACDYPDFARAVAYEVAEGRADAGIVIDGAGIGSAMAANKVPGVLAANCWDVRTARNAREHNHANVLTLGAGHLDLAAAREVVAAFLGTALGGERHARRVAKILALERERAPRRADTFDPSR